MKLISNKIDFSKEKILITGHSGMVGSSVINKLKNKGRLGTNIICPNIDLRNDNETLNMIRFFQPTYIIHLAAKVGGVKANSNYLADFFIDNIKINTNILNSAKICNVKKVVSILSTCIYPDLCIYPLTEDQIHSGEPHSSNYAYAYAKRMLDIQSKAYRDQFGCNFVTVVPNNIFGIKDNFNLEDSHVIPAIIRKIYEAKLNNTDVVLWGNGEQLREFTYADDIAEILLFMLEEYNERDPINIGNSEEYCLRWIVSYISKILEFNGNVIWDINKPSGQLRKPSNNSKFKEFVSKYNKELKYTMIDDGLIEVCNWFKNNYPNVRGVNL